jgi:hypothetical protein
VVLSGRDVLMAPQEVRLWLHWQSTAAVMYNPNIAHAGFLLDLGWQRAIIRRLLALRRSRKGGVKSRRTSRAGSDAGRPIGRHQVNGRGWISQQQQELKEQQQLKATTAAAAAADRGGDIDSGDEEWYEAAAEAKATNRISLEDARRGLGGQVWVRKDLERAVLGARGASLQIEPGEVAAARAAGTLVMKPNLLQPITLPNSFASPFSQQQQQKQQKSMGGAVAGVRVPVKPAPAGAQLMDESGATASASKRGAGSQHAVPGISAVAGVKKVGREELSGLVKQYPGVQLQLQQVQQMLAQGGSPGRLGGGLVVPARGNGRGQGLVTFGRQVQEGHTASKGQLPSGEAASAADGGSEPAGLGRDLEQLAQGRDGVFGGNRSAAYERKAEAYERKAENGGYEALEQRQQGAGSAGISRSGSMASARESWHGSEGGGDEMCMPGTGVEHCTDVTEKRNGTCGAGEVVG